ncbi:MAG: VWA domain-containing protein [Deltaproteobacteria bacterium]|nr:VWA domain-containing protein [Deltaproteobacteria bacterium]
MKAGYKKIPVSGLLAAVLFCCIPARAQPVHHRAWAHNVVVPQSRSFIMVHPQAAAFRQPVQISKIKVGVVILEQVATTTMDISLRNPSHARQEAELLVPVPDGAIVRGFDFQGAAKEPTAKLLPRAEAKRIYNSIVAQVRDPALLEFAGYNLIRSSVFPVAARGTQKVRLTYEHLLAADGDRVDYVLPRSESLDYTIPWSISVKVKSKRNISTVYSPSHKIQTVRTSEHQVAVRAGTQTRLDPGHFRLSYLLERGSVTASVFAYPDPKVGGGYFLLLAGLQALAENKTEHGSKIPREVTLVIDRSGSMNGEKLEQVKAAALQVIAGLDQGEAFNLIVYNEAVDLFSEKPVIKTAASEKQARKWMTGIQARGGTNIHDALVEALSPKPTRGMLPIVLFLTDGLPTIGQTSEVVIREVAIKANKAKRRIFTFGVGADVNTPLLEKIAAKTRAFATFVLANEDVEVKLAKVFRGLKGPVLADTSLKILGGKKGGSGYGRVRDVLPKTLPDLFEGDQLVLLGRYVGKMPVTFEVSGNYLGKHRAFRFKLDPQRATTRNNFVPRLWASRKIAILIDHIRSAGADTDRAAVRAAVATHPRFKELVDEIIRLSTEFGVLTEYTAFLAREGTDLGQRHVVMQEAQRNFVNRAIKTRSGIGSVNQSMNMQSQAKQQVLNPSNAYYDQNMNRVSVSNVQQVADRAFYRRSNRWVDSTILDKERKIKPKKVITFGSKDFLQLVERLANEGRQGSIALQGDILLVVDGEAILVRNPTTP